MLKLVLAIAAAGVLTAAAAAGVTGPAFYVDGQLYRTVNTPTDLSGTGAPAHAWDTIYDFGGNQMNVATAAPGDRGYNGGRWQVHALSFPSGYAAALAAGDTNGSGADRSTPRRVGIVRRSVIPIPTASTSRPSRKSRLVTMSPTPVRLKIRSSPKISR